MNIRQKRKQKKSLKGFTMLEVLIVTSLLAIFSGFLISLVQVANNAFDITSKGSSMSAEAKRGLESMTNEIRTADADNAIPFSLAAGQTSTTNVTFVTPLTYDNTGATSWQCVRYNYNANAANANPPQIERQEGASCGALGTATRVASNVSLFQVSRGTGSNSNLVTIQVDVTDPSTTKAKAAPVTFISEVVIRN